MIYLHAMLYPRGGNSVTGPGWAVAASPDVFERERARERERERERKRERESSSVIQHQPVFQCDIIRRHGHHTPFCIESNPRTIFLLVVAQVGEHRQVATSHAIPVHAMLSRPDALMATLRADCREFASIWQRLQRGG